MTLTMKRVLIAILVLSSAGAIYWWANAPDVAVQQSNSMPPTQTESSDSPSTLPVIAGNVPRGDQVSLSELGRSPWSAPNFSSMSDALATSKLSEGEVIYLRTRAAMMCHGFENYGQAPDHDTRLPPGSPARISADVTFQFLEGFCDGDAMHWSLEADRMNDLPSSDPVAMIEEAAMIAIEGAQGELADADLEMALTTLEAEMWNSEGATSLIAADALASLGAVSSQTSDFIRTNGLTLEPGEASQMQLLAAKLGACRTLGGCGSGELFSMMQCRQTNTCAAGITAMDAWRKSYPPRLIDGALKLDNWKRKRAKAAQ